MSGGTTFRQLRTPSIAPPGARSGLSEDSPPAPRGAVKAATTGAVTGGVETGTPVGNPRRARGIDAAVLRSRTVTTATQVGNPRRTRHLGPAVHDAA